MNLIQGWIITWLLASLRFAPLFMIPSVTPFAWAPAQIRSVLVLALGAAVVSTMPHVLPVPSMAWAATGELVVGGCLALAVVIPMAALGNAAKLLDVQAGLASASLFNPALQSNDSIFGTFFSLAGMQVFFGLGFDLLVLRALVASARLAPVGAAARLPDAEAVLAMVGVQFLLGLMVVAPVVLGLFAIDLAVAYASRSMPQANVYFLALPVKVGIAFLLLATTVHTMPALVGRLFADALERSRAAVGL
jgi:flagellar biosynthesis protein FliR